MPDLAAVSERALIGRCALVGCFAQQGSSHVSRSRCRAPVSGWRRTTAQSLVGATFQEGPRFGSALTVPKIRAMASAGRKLA